MPVTQGLRLYCSTRDVQGRSHIVAGTLDLPAGTAIFDETASGRRRCPQVLDDSGEDDEVIRW